MTRKLTKLREKSNIMATYQETYKTIVISLKIPKRISKLGLIIYLSFIRFEAFKNEIANAFP